MSERAATPMLLLLTWQNKRKKSSSDVCDNNKNDSLPSSSWRRTAGDGLKCSIPIWTIIGGRRRNRVHRFQIFRRKKSKHENFKVNFKVIISIKIQNININCTMLWRTFKDVKLFVLQFIQFFSNHHYKTTVLGIEIDSSGINVLIESK